MNTLLRFHLLPCQSCRSLSNKSLGGRILGLIKSFHHGWLSMMTSSEGLLFSLASGPPNPKATAAHNIQNGFPHFLLLFLRSTLLLNRNKQIGE